MLTINKTLENVTPIGLNTKIEIITNPINNNRNDEEEINFYIPELIFTELNKVLLNNPPCFNFKRDVFNLILHLVGEIPNNNKKVKNNIRDNDGFTPISSTVLQTDYKIRDYKLYLDYLVDNQILHSDNHYICKVKCKGFKYNPHFNSFLIPCSCTQLRINHTLENIRNSNKLHAEIQYPYLCKWFNDDLQIDYEKALNKISIQYLNNSNIYPSLMDDYENKKQQYLLELQRQNYKKGRIHYCLKEFKEENMPSNPIEIYNSHFRTIEKFRLKKWSYVVDGTAGRFHSNITALPKILRECITYRGKRLKSYDIKNAQVYLSIVFLKKELFIRRNILEKISKYNKYYMIEWNKVNNNNKDISTIMLVELIEKNENSDDVRKYIELALNGDIYMFFGKHLVGENFEKLNDKEIRALGKQELIECLFRSNSAINFKESSKVFQKLFPNVYSIFKEIKKGRKSEENDDKPNKSLACTLQSIEADLVLNKICKEYSEIHPNEYNSTVHDCIVTTEEMIEKIKPIIIMHLNEFIGYEPKVDFENW